MGKGIGKKLESKGRHGDTILAHINPKEAMMLKRMGGKGSINPRTGLREYWDDGGNDPGGVGGETGSGAAGGPDSDDGGNVNGGFDPTGGSGLTGINESLGVEVSAPESVDLGGYQGIMDDIPVYSSMMRGINTLRDDYPNAYAAATGALKSGIVTGFNPLSMGIGAMVGVGAKGATDRSSMSPEALAENNKSLSEALASKDIASGTDPLQATGEEIGSDLTGSEYLDVPASVAANRIILRGRFDKNLGISQANKVKVYR